MPTRDNTVVQYGCIVAVVAQQQRILDAVLAVVASCGLPAVSVRTVAATADVSPAQVQYYFGTKDRLLIAAFEHVHDRMRQRAAAVDTCGTTVEVLRRYLLTWFPLDASRRTDAIVWLAFTAAATTTTQFKPIVRRADSEVIQALTRLIARGQAVDAIRAELQPATTASLLLAVVDGLSVRALTHPDPNHLLDELDQFLVATLLSGSE